MFQVQPEQIAALNPERFVMFANDLIWAEANRHAILPEALTLNSRIYEGGVDAKVDDASGRSDERWLPQGLSVWEFKSGPIKPGIVKAEVLKRRQELEMGARIIIATGASFGTTLLVNRRRALTEALRGLGLPPERGRFLSGSDLARWATEHLSAVLFFGVPIGSCLRVTDWERSEFHQGQFVADEQREEIKLRVGAFVSASGSPVHFRVEGRRGIGKTRLVLEAVRGAGIRLRTLYAQDPGMLPREFWNWARSEPRLSGVLVVDECDNDEASRFKEQADSCEGRIKLITIGVTERAFVAPSPTRHLLDELGEEQMREALRLRFSDLSDEHVRWITRLARGYIRLAVASAEAVLLDPSIDIFSLTNSPDVRDVLSVLLPDAAERRTMQGLALLSRVGVDAELAAEGQILARFLGIGWPEFCDVTERSYHRGLVQKRGRYRYVTPDLLAAWLAADIWDTRGDDIPGLLQQLPSDASRQALLDRLKDLGPHPKARTIVEGLLGEGGLFRDLTSLTDATRCRILHSLALAAPTAAVATLERLLCGASREAVAQLHDGRHWIVWALDFIKRFSLTFFRAARLLLLLADTRSHARADNADEHWTSMFQISLGGTEVPAADRHLLIEEALGSESPRLRALGVKAIAAVLASHQTRSAGSETDAPSATPIEWRPATWGEVWSVFRSALKLLDRAMADPDISVARDANKTFLGACRSIVRSGLADEVIARLEVQHPSDDGARRHFRETIESILQYEELVLNRAQIDRLVALQQRIAGTSFRERLRRWVGQWSHHDYDIHERDGGVPVQERAEQLADEAYANPTLLGEELSWLVSDEAQNVGYFGRRLGAIDETHTWLPHLTDLARVGMGAGLLATYLWGRSEASERAWVDGLLDEWSTTEPTLAPIVFSTIWRRGPASSDIDRLERLVERAWLQPKSLHILRYGRWLSALTLDELKRILTMLLRDEGEEATDAGLSAIADRLKSQPEAKDSLQPLASEFLERLPRTTGERTTYSWGLVARVYAQERAEVIAGVILDTLMTNDRYFHEGHDVTDILALTTRAEPRRVWERVGDLLLRVDRERFRLQMTLEGWFVRNVDPEIPLRWADEHRPRGPGIVASLTTPDGTPLATLPRELLRRFHDDEEVAERLYGNLITGGHSGNTSTWLEGKLVLAQQWMLDPDAHVAAWGSHTADSLEKWARRERLREEEDELRR